jgi:pimeloyl-ACP methyl ester carboxylesterase
VEKVDVTTIPWRPQLSVPWLATARGVGVEAGWAARRLAGIPVDLADWSLRQLTGRLGTAVSWLPPGPVQEQEAASGMPVMLVHGLADRASVFSPLQRGLRDCGAGPVTAVRYSMLTADLRVAAQALGDEIERVRPRSGGQAVCVIGYSLGGLIARYYVQRLGGDAHVPLVITLATPHGGTATALLAPPHPLLRQLRPGSELLAELAEPAAGCRTRFVAFYSDLDEAVIPAGRARIDHPDLQARSVLVHGVGHLALPIHKPVIDEIRTILTELTETQQVTPAE